MATLEVEVRHFIDVLSAQSVLMQNWRKRFQGKRVRLLEEIANPKEKPGCQVYVPKGEIGLVVDITSDPAAPFRVKFQDFPYVVIIAADKIEFLTGQEL